MIEASEIISPPERLSCWTWNCQNVDYGLDRSYKAATPGRYDPTLMPWWKGLVDLAFDSATKEFVLIAPSQTGKEEHLLCFPARYWAANGFRKDVLYVGHQDTKVETIFRSRVRGSMTLTEQTQALIADADELGFVYKIGGSKFACTHASTGGGLKGEPWDILLCSEISSYKSIAILDEARKRGNTRPTFKIIMWGCPDWRMKRASDDDVLFIEHGTGSQHELCMLDHVTGSRFFFDVGDGKGAGIRFDPAAKREDGSYDFDVVEKTAYYLTPDGTRIDECDRWKTVLTGEWQPQNPKAASGKISAHVHQLMMPWANVGGFGHIARRMMESIAKGPESHRAFRYEVEARKWHGQKFGVADTELEKRQGSYERGVRLATLKEYADLVAGKKSIVTMQIDVQSDQREDNLYYTVQEWWMGGNSALVDYGHCATWAKAKEIAAKYGVSRLTGAWAVFIDNSYEERSDEVYEQCISGVMKGAVPVFGRDNLKTWYEIKARDPYEGTAKQSGKKIPMLTFNPNDIKTHLWKLLNGVDRHIYLLPTGSVQKTIDGQPTPLLRHLTSEVCTDGAWVRLHKDNHWWDCCAFGLAAAMVLGYFLHADPDTPVKPEEPKPEQKPATEKPPEPQAKKAVLQDTKRVTYGGSASNDDDDEDGGF